MLEEVRDKQVTREAFTVIIAEQIAASHSFFEIALQSAHVYLMTWDSVWFVPS